MGETPEKKTGVHQFVDLGWGSHGDILTPRMHLELIVAAAIVVVSVYMLGAGLGEGSTQVRTHPRSQASCASARARELGISPAAVPALRREFAGQDMCSFSFKNLTPSEKALVPHPGYYHP